MPSPARAVSAGEALGELPSKRPPWLYTAYASSRGSFNSEGSTATLSSGSSASCTAPSNESERPSNITSKAWRRLQRSRHRAVPENAAAQTISASNTAITTRRSSESGLIVPTQRGQPIPSSAQCLQQQRIRIEPQLAPQIGDVSLNYIRVMFPGEVVQVLQQFALGNNNPRPV